MKPLFFDVFEEDSRNILLELALSAAGENVLFDITNPDATAEAAAVAGTREIWIAPFVDGVALANTFIFLAKLRSGDTGPTPEPVTEDVTYDNGVVVQNQTGVNNGAKTWEIEGSADEPAISLLIDHCTIPGYGSVSKRGKSFAYIAYNQDRSASFGSAKVNTANVPREGKHRWAFNVPFQSVGFRRPNQNPVSGVVANPTYTSKTPATGANTGPTAVTVTGTNLSGITAIRVGTTRIDDSEFTSQSQTTLVFNVPAGLSVGSKNVNMESDNGDIAAGVFAVTAS